MDDYHVVAWNYVDERGEPIIEIDEDVDRDEYVKRIVGRYAFISSRMLRPVSIDAVLDYIKQKEMK